MPPIKPSFPNPSVRNVQQNLDRLSELVKGSKMADGTVQVETLEKKVRATNDPGLIQGFERIKDEFQTTKQVVGTNCDGTTYSHEKTVDPELLASGQVQSVMSALMAAKSKVAGADRDGSQTLSRTELEAAGFSNSFIGELAQSAVFGSLTEYRGEIEEWRDKLNDTYHDIKSRKSLDSSIESRADWHTSSEEASQAVKWAFRDLATRGSVDSWTMDDKLNDAERSFLWFIPLFKDTSKGHLSDSEVRKFLGTDDLRQFAADKKAKVEARVGNYENAYLQGADLEGADQLRDPDFKVDNRCN